MQGTVFLKEHRYLIAAFIVIALYFAPFYILGENTPTLVHDNLDSNVVWFTILPIVASCLTPWTAIPQVMNGIPVIHLDQSSMLFNGSICF